MRLNGTEPDTDRIIRSFFKTFYGENTHHIIESIFKGVARALSQACEIDEKYKDEVLSTKGMLEDNKNK